MTGVEAVLVYTLDIFLHSGSIIDAQTSVIVVGCLQVLTTLISALIVDKLGRRKLLLISSIGTSFAMSILGFWFYNIGDVHERVMRSSNDGISSHTWIPLVTLGVFIVSFSLGLGPIPFVMIAELNSTKMVGVASACCTTFNWTFAFLVTRYFLISAHSVGFHILFWSFAIFSVVGALLIFLFVPETKGKSMDEIQRYFKMK